MSDLRWSTAEKKIARQAYDEALEAALSKAMAEFKARATAAATPGDMWDVEVFLRETRREIDRTFDYRYSQLLSVFALLIRQGHMEEAALSGLSEDKRAMVRHILSFQERS